MSKKIVIAFEGIEGSGKTFHIDNVSKYLKRKKIPHIKLREPGGNKNSEKIRKLILDKKSNFKKKTDLLLYLAARSENMDNLKKNFRKKIILLDRFTDSTIAYQHFGLGVNLDIPILISDKINAGILEKAKLLNIKSEVCLVNKLNYKLNREEYDESLDLILSDYKIDYILLVGFMRILSANFCKKWENKILNIHPSLLPKYQGLMDLSVHQAVLDNNDFKTGCSVHFVTADVDAGPIVSQKIVLVNSDDDAIKLKKRVQSKEVMCYLDAVRGLCINK